MLIINTTKQLRNIVSSQIIERNSRSVQQLIYASPTNFLLQSIDTTRDARQGKRFLWIPSVSRIKLPLRSWTGE